MRALGILIGCGVALIGSAAFAASDNTVLIRNADVYPVTSAEMKGVSVLIQDGKIAEHWDNATKPMYRQDWNFGVQHQLAIEGGARSAVRTG